MNQPWRRRPAKLDGAELRACQDDPCSMRLHALEEVAPAWVEAGVAEAPGGGGLQVELQIGPLRAAAARRAQLLVRCELPRACHIWSKALYLGHSLYCLWLQASPIASPVEELEQAAIDLLLGHRAMFPGDGLCVTLFRVEALAERHAYLRKRRREARCQHPGTHMFESQRLTARPVAFSKMAPRQSRITSRCCSVPCSPQSGERCLQQRITRLSFMASAPSVTMRSCSSSNACLTRGQSN